MSDFDLGSLSGSDSRVAFDGKWAFKDASEFVFGGRGRGEISYVFKASTVLGSGLPFFGVDGW